MHTCLYIRTIAPIIGGNIPPNKQGGTLARNGSEINSSTFLSVEACRSVKRRLVQTVERQEGTEISDSTEHSGRAPKHRRRCWCRAWGLLDHVPSWGLFRSSFWRLYVKDPSPGGGFNCWVWAATVGQDTSVSGAMFRW